MNRCRTTVRTGVVALGLVLALADCSSDDPSGEPDAGSRTSAGASSDGTSSATPSASTAAPGDGASEPADGGSTPALPEGPGGDPTGWVLADELDTNAPVDASALPDGVTVEQVADARKAWNGRATQLKAGGSACEVVGAVWIGVAGEGATRKVLIGAEEGKRATCRTTPLMTVDAASNTVLEGAQFAALL